MTPEERVQHLKDEADLWPADAAMLEMLTGAIEQEREECALQLIEDAKHLRKYLRVYEAEITEKAAESVRKRK